jgi:glycosyltransferase involved in cell wall biosynthesis
MPSPNEDEMDLRVTYIERRDADTASIERVFKQVAVAITKFGVTPSFEKLPYGNGFIGLIRNIIGFRPKTSDIYHITGHVHYIVLALRNKHTVLTIHDLGILRNRTGLRRAVIKKLYFDWPIQKANAITAISEATKQDVVRSCGIDADRVLVIENPLTVEPRQRPKPAFNAVCPRILHIGTAPHKNLERTMEAVRDVNCELVIVGELSSLQIEALKRHNVRYSNHPSLADEGIAEQYYLADMVVFCSTFEGFGLPIIEAQAVGTPVITSDLSPMKDVAGAGAMLVDPSDPIAITAAINAVIGDESLRSRLVQDGNRNLERFKTEKIAREYAEVYRRVMAEN